MLAAQSEPDALRARLRELGGKNATIQEHERTASGVRFTLLQGVGAEKLPQAVRTLHKGDLVVHREQTFEPEGDSYTGVARASVGGVPGEITIRTEITPRGAGTAQHTVGAAKVNVPLVGGKLEAVIAEQVTNLLRMEAEFTAKWLAGKH